MSSPYYRLLKNKIDMTQGQIDFINAITDVHLGTFLRLKEEQFNSVWSDECDSLFFGNKDWDYSYRWKLFITTS